MVMALFMFAALTRVIWEYAINLPAMTGVTPLDAVLYLIGGMGIYIACVFTIVYITLDRAAVLPATPLAAARPTMMAPL